MFKTFLIMVSCALFLIAADFNHYRDWLYTVNAAPAETTIIVNDAVIKNCAWDRVRIMVQDVVAPIGNEVDGVVKWALYTQDGNFISYDDQDSIIVSDTGTWYTKDHWTPPTLGYKADLVFIPTTGFTATGTIKITPQVTCYY